MDIIFIALVFFIVIAIACVLIFLFKSINKKSFLAEDGSVFDSQSDLDLYQRLYEKTKPLFSEEIDNNSSQSKLGFENSFLTKLTKEGFKDLKTLIKYGRQFKSLSDLINP